jgi:hypothetical protein
VHHASEVSDPNVKDWTVHCRDINKAEDWQILFQSTGHPVPHICMVSLHCSMLAGQLVISQSAPSRQCTMQSPEPGHSTVQSPRHVTMQLPEPVQDMVLPASTSTTHSPEDAQETLQATSHVKSQFPEPVHERSQSSPQ